jgi:sn-glycerol 3-phosphate transport system permease protein
MLKQSYFKVPLIAYLLVLPQLLVSLIFFFWPAWQALYQSFFVEDPFGIHRHFVWFRNFIELFSTRGYLHSVLITFTFSIAVTVFALFGGLCYAVLVERVTRGKAIYQTLLIWPYAVAPAIAGMLMRFLFDPAIGIFPYWMAKFGYTWNFNTHAWQALFLVIITASWQQVSYNFIFYLASIKALPKSMMEAASLDGAGPFRRFFTITFPMLSPITFFLIVINMLYAFFDTFGIIQVVTQGGPANATQTLVYKVYQDGFLGLDFGSSAAQSVLLMLIIAVLTVIQFRFIEKRVHY